MDMLMYCLLSGVVVIIATTGLLTERLKWWQYVIGVCYVTEMAMLGVSTGKDHLMGIPMILILLLLLTIAVKENKVENVCLACVGYLLNVLLNTGILFVLSVIPQIDVTKISNEYAEIFSAVYSLVELAVILLVRKVIYDRFSVSRYMREGKKLKSVLAWNLIFFCLVVLINIFMGSSVGYSNEMLLLNCIIFAVCMVSSSILLVECAKNIQSEESRKAEEHQKEFA